MASVWMTKMLVKPLRKYAASDGPAIAQKKRPVSVNAVSEREDAYLSAADMNMMPTVGRASKNHTASGYSTRRRQPKPKPYSRFVPWSPAGPQGAAAISTTPPLADDYLVYPDYHGISGRRPNPLDGAGQIWRLGRQL